MKHNAYDYTIIFYEFRAKFGDDDNDSDDNVTSYHEESQVYEPKPIGSNNDEGDDEEDELDKFMAGIEVKKADIIRAILLFVTAY